MSLTNLGNATRLGLMKILSIAKDCDVRTKEFTIDELMRHFTANAQMRILRTVRTS